MFGFLRMRFIIGVSLMMAASLAGYVGKMNSVAAKATVVTIDRLCTFIAQDDTKSRTEEDCNNTPEFRTLADSGKHSRRIDGKAVIHVVYPSPTDGSTQAGDLHFTGRDDEFYDLKAGDTVPIRVNKDDVTKIRAA